MTQMKKLISWTLLTTPLMLAFQLCLGGELHHVKMPDSLLLDGKPLQLNGMGAREATIFKVKVYIAGLYLETRSQNADSILNSSSLKKLTLNFVHAVGAAKLKDAWKEGIEKNCSNICASLEDPLKRFLGTVVDLKEGDTLSFVFYPEKVVVQTQAQGLEKQEIIMNKEFSRTLLSIWLGKEPPNSGIKEGLLGQIKN